MKIAIVTLAILLSTQVFAKSELECHRTVQTEFATDINSKEQFKSEVKKIVKNLADEKVDFGEGLEDEYIVSIKIGENQVDGIIVSQWKTYSFSSGKIYTGSGVADEAMEELGHTKLNSDRYSYDDCELFIKTVVKKERYENFSFSLENGQYKFAFKGTGTFYYYPKNKTVILKALEQLL